jgi:RHS repeat-associated protein
MRHAIWLVMLGPVVQFASRRTAMTLPNGTQTTYSYDPASQVTQILHQLTATSTQINQAAYAYNPVGNRTSLTDKRGAQAFGYDSLDRLTSASHPLLATPQAFAYDPVGNRTTGGSIVNAGNQLTADATHSYQYDDNGNLTRKTLLATGNFAAYTYDAENRLTKVEDFVAGNPTAFATSTYRYDGLGRRIEKVANGQTKRYLYDGEDILLEYDGANVLQARYTHGPGIDEPIAITKGGSTFFYHQDGLGTVTDLTDSAGATAKSYSYDAYGNLVDQTGTLEQPYTYTGREFDSESGLYYYRARNYDPVTGRFLQKDPIGLRGGVNSYLYANGVPTFFNDPFGLMSRAQCDELRGRIIRNTGDLLVALYKYDPASDGIGGHSYNAGRSKTKPGMHNKKIKERQSGLMEDITRYLKECTKKCNDGPPPPPLPEWVEEAATRPIPDVVYPVPQGPMIMGPVDTVPIPEIPSWMKGMAEGMVGGRMGGGRLAPVVP